MFPCTSDILLNMFLRGISSNTFSLLSDVLPIKIDKSLATNSGGKQLEIREVDDFLPPEDKLRGIFLQKLRGKAAIHRSLSSVGIELNSDLFAKVVNRGNLCGESMVLFFTWAMEQQPNFCNPIDAYHIVLKALGRKKFFRHMMEMFEGMRDKGVSPNSETLSIVMDSYLRAHHVAKATKIFRELGQYGLKCNEETLSVAIRCLTQRSHVGVACSLFNKMKEHVRCDCAMYNIIIGGWSRFGRITEVEKFLKVMVDDGVEPDCITYGYLIESFGRARRVDDAGKIFKFLEEKGTLSVEVYSGMIVNYIAIDDIDEALKYYEKMISSSMEPNLDTYTRIIRYFLKIRRVADAIEMFDEMLGRGVIPPTGTVTDFLEPLCCYGPPHAALMIYNKARKAGCRISLTAYKLLLMRLSRFGKFGMLVSIWEEMQESGYACDVQVYDYVINGLCNMGRLETAVLVMEESIRKGFFPNKIICSKLKNKLMEADKVEMAYKLFLKLRNARADENAVRFWRAKGWHF
ncbi:putative pentatricopeptide repeat-containing protein At5g43820 isoform X2 [Andrographis paniculata]|uniref:putative pentatricopeptide repeat-containing protein At5g43820 isoform X2 n=1 Tax=Andrographis paniculata TaxID=175694 RepID=UPI0021E9975E|nr:putative pentatricopeptide repeat-containing protein At5g43820 isoform X2 [Andrographis paniculata]